jgi:hypothetical protein
VRNMLLHTGGTIYLSVENVDENKSEKIGVNYGAEPVLNMLNSSDVTVMNAEPVSNMLNSSDVTVMNAEPVSNTLNPSDVTVINNIGTSNDSIVVNGLTSGDVIRIYDTANGGTELVSKTTYGPSLEILANDLSREYGYSKDLLIQTGGIIYVSVDSLDKNESGRIAVKYGSEQVSNMLNSSEVIVRKAEQVSNMLNSSEVIVRKAEQVSNMLNSSDVTVTNAQSGSKVLNSSGCSGQELVSKATSSISLEKEADSLLNAYGGSSLMQKEGTIYVSVESIDEK